MGKIVDCLLYCAELTLKPKDNVKITRNTNILDLKVTTGDIYRFYFLLSYAFNYDFFSKIDVLPSDLNKTIELIKERGLKPVKEDDFIENFLGDAEECFEEGIIPQFFRVK